MNKLDSGISGISDSVRLWPWNHSDINPPDIDVNVESSEWRTAAELVSLIIVLKRPLLYLSVQSIVREQEAVGEKWFEKTKSVFKWHKDFYQKIFSCKKQSFGFHLESVKKWNYRFCTFTKSRKVCIKQNGNSRTVVILNMNELMMFFLTVMAWAKKAMKIMTNQENKMLLFCHHAKSHQCCCVASMRIWGICLLNLSHFLRIVWRGSGEMVCFTYFGSLFQLFFHFDVMFWLYGSRVVNLKSESLNRHFCECATGMIWVQGFFQAVSATG